MEKDLYNKNAGFTEHQQALKISFNVSINDLQYR